MEINSRGIEMRDFFNRKIESYDMVHEKFMDTKKSLIQALNGEIKTVLDLGAGTGLELIYLFERYPNVQVTAIDISENMLHELAKRDFADKVRLICGDFFEVEFGQNYDAVISTSALHHFNEQDKLILYRKILKSLKLNGQFVNCDKVAANQEEQDNCWNEYFKNPHKFPHMDTPLTKENERKILQHAGFSDIEVIENSTIEDHYALIKAIR